jgi:hypothetical protein
MYELQFQGGCVQKPHGPATTCFESDALSRSRYKIRHGRVIAFLPFFLDLRERERWQNIQQGWMVGK